MRWLTFSTLVAVSGACAAELGPAIDPNTLEVQFTSTPSLCSQELHRTYERRISGTAGAIEVAEIYGAANGGYELVPTLQGPGPGELLIRITGINHGGIAVVMCHPYLLVVSGLAAGRYEVRLIHAERGRERMDTLRVVTATVQ